MTFESKLLSSSEESTFVSELSLTLCFILINIEFRRKDENDNIKLIYFAINVSSANKWFDTEINRKLNLGILKRFSKLFKRACSG